MFKVTESKLFAEDYFAVYHPKAGVMTLGGNRQNQIHLFLS